MKKTILALAIAGSVVLLTGCNAEDDAVKYSGADINTKTKAIEYAKNVRIMNELIIQNCYNENTVCKLNPANHQGNFHLNSITLDLTTSGDKVTVKSNVQHAVKLFKNKEVVLTATFNNSSSNNHYILFNKNSNEVKFTGQYMDSHGRQFQSATQLKGLFTYSDSRGEFETGGVASLDGKKGTAHWKWGIDSARNVEIK